MNDTYGPIDTIRATCAEPCPNLIHTCDRSPQHTGFHRDIQQKGQEGCSWYSDGQHYGCAPAVTEELPATGIHSPGGPAL